MSEQSDTGIPHPERAAPAHDRLRFSATIECRQVTQNNAQRILELIHGKRMEEVRRLVHSVKGAAATLGVRSVHESALAVESALQGGRADPERKAPAKILAAALSESCRTLLDLLPSE